MLNQVDPDEQTPSDNSGQQTIPGQVVEQLRLVMM